MRYATHDLDLQSSSAHITVSGSVLSDAALGLYSESTNYVRVDSTSFQRDNIGAFLDCFGCSYMPQLREVDFREDPIGVWASGNTAALIDKASFIGVKEDAHFESTALRSQILHTRAAGEGSYISVIGNFMPTGVVHLDSDLPYVVSGRLTVPLAGLLTLAPGTIAKFRSIGPEPGRFDVLGSLVASGTETSPVVLTGVSDDVGGHCSCASLGATPAAGDWRGLVVRGSATLDHTLIRYAATDAELWEGAAAAIEDSDVSDAGTGLAANGPATLAVANTNASRDGTGMQFGCSGGCSFVPQVRNVNFESDSTAVAVTGTAAPQIRASSFALSDAWGVFNSGSATVDARGNWWGAASGPAPAGAGPKLSGSVEFQPFCTAVDQCASIELTATRTSIAADGKAQTTLTATTNSPTGPVPGHHIYFSSSDLGDSFGPVVDNGDGTYSTTLTASRRSGDATVRVVDSSVGSAPSASLIVTQVAPEVFLSLAPESISADGKSQTTATATIDIADEPLSGEEVELTSTDPGETIGPVTDNGDGTYTATIMASNSSGVATITARDVSATPPVEATAQLTETNPAEIHLDLRPSAILANGSATSIVTVSLKAGDEPLAGNAVQLLSTDPGETIGPVTDNGDGTYTATITASRRIGAATITATAASLAPALTTSAVLKQVKPRQLQISLSPTTIAANGGATTTAKVAATSGGQPLSGEHITVASSDPGETIGPVTDHGDGTYTATITASKTVGSATISATDGTEGLDLVKAAVLRQIAPKVVMALAPNAIPANGRATAMAKISVTSGSSPLSGEHITVASSDPGETIGPVTDHGDGTYTATITASKTVGSATITTSDQSSSPSAIKTAVLKQVAPSLTVSLAPGSVPANAQATTTATAKLAAAGQPLSGEKVSFTSTDPGETIGPVTDNGDGTYTATITASKAVGSVTITATDESTSPGIAKTVVLKQVAPSLTLTLAPNSLIANGVATTVATLKLVGAGRPLSGEHITLASSDPGETIGPVTDHGDGTYTATITASKTVGSATITATDESVAPGVSKTAILKQK